MPKYWSHVFVLIGLLCFGFVQAHAAPKPRYIGWASWYGQERQGHKMTNGQRFDRFALTAASYAFPLNTTLKVVNLSNGRVTTVTVTDRGPSRRLGRFLDLSQAAADQLGYLAGGVTRVLAISMVRINLEFAEFDALLIGPAY